jgi:hypothetical protein
MENRKGQVKTHRKQSPVQLEHFEAIEKRLWNAADTVFKPAGRLIEVCETDPDALGGGGGGSVRKRVPACLVGLPHGAVAVLRGASLKQRRSGFL